MSKRQHDEKKADARAVEAMDVDDGAPGKGDGESSAKRRRTGNPSDDMKETKEQKELIKTFPVMIDQRAQQTVRELKSALDGISGMTRLLPDINAIVAAYGRDTSVHAQTLARLSDRKPPDEAPTGLAQIGPNLLVVPVHGDLLEFNLLNGMM